MDTVKKDIISLCSKVFENAGADVEIIEYLDLSDDLGMDSITFISLIVAIESFFGIIIPDRYLSIDFFRRVDDIVCLINKLIS